MAPPEVFSWGLLLTIKGIVVIVVGGPSASGRLTPAAARRATQSPAADLQLPSLLAVCGFFAGGLAATYLLLPILLG